MFCSKVASFHHKSVVLYRTQFKKKLQGSVTIHMTERRMCTDSFPLIRHFIASSFLTAIIKHDRPQKSDFQKNQTCHGKCLGSKKRKKKLSAQLLVNKQMLNPLKAIRETRSTASTTGADESPKSSCTKSLILHID